jgi:regulator of protease activity HflC (stomatin/prohibitin superfamily)
MHWSNFSKPPENQTTARETITTVDMRARKIFFDYEVRTSDNVKLSVDGTIFWRVENLQMMINATSDPEGDVWHHARSALIEAVSQVTLERFMSGFNDIVMEAFHRQAQDGFYAERGVELESMEVTRFDCADPETAQVLQQIIQETTNRINRLTAQQSENEVRAAAMTANITLERSRTEFIRTQAENHRMQSQMQGEAEGMKLVRSANAFIGGLSESLPSVSSRVGLYRLHEEIRGRNADTENLASGSAHLFLTPQDLNLRLDTSSAGAGVQEL